MPSHRLLGLRHQYLQYQYSTQVAFHGQENLGQLETPLQSRGGSHHTWENDLQLYLQKQGSTPEGVNVQRDTLLCSLRAKPTGAEQWWDFLNHEETGVHITYQQAQVASFLQVVHS